MEKTYKYSRQREALYSMLQATTEHPTADWLYARLKPEFHDLSLGTVYRNLNILVEQGLVLRLHYGSTFDRYDACRDPHHHFLCEHCGAVLDIPLAADRKLNARIEQQTGHLVRGHSIDFYGLCVTCRAKAPADSDSRDRQAN